MLTAERTQRPPRYARLVVGQMLYTRLGGVCAVEYLEME
jgi:hypothetical protein